MKNSLLLLFAVCLLCFTNVNAQVKRTGIPHFRIGRTDRTYFDDGKLKKGKRVLFIYFLPDCDDCRQFTTVLLKNLADLHDLQIVMITNSNLDMLTRFEHDFNLKNYRNIIAGTESYTGLFQNQFHIESFPFAAAYDKSGKLIRVFENYKDPEVLIREIKSVYRQ